MKKLFKLPRRLFAPRGLKNYCSFWANRIIEVQSQTNFFVVQNTQSLKVAFFVVPERCMDHCRKLKKKKTQFLIYSKDGTNVRIDSGKFVLGDRDLNIVQYSK